MPSTSGDASDGDLGGSVLRGQGFQCPQHRAMHLTLQKQATTHSHKVSMPSTSGDASDLFDCRKLTLDRVSMPSTSGDASD